MSLVDEGYRVKALYILTPKYCLCASVLRVHLSSNNV